MNLAFLLVVALDASVLLEPPPAPEWRHLRTPRKVVAREGGSAIVCDNAPAFTRPAFPLHDARVGYLLLKPLPEREWEQESAAAPEARALRKKHTRGAKIRP